MVGPSYIILGGTSKGQGAVITREEALSLHLWTIANNLRHKDFYVLQTNYDNWVQAPFFGRLSPSPPPSPQYTIDLVVCRWIPLRLHCDCAR